MILNDLKGERRALTVSINEKPLNLRYFSSAATPEVEELITQLQNQDEETREQHLQTQALQKIVAELIADWELFVDAESEKKKKPLPVCLETMHIVPISAQWQILLAIFQDLQVDPTSGGK